MQRLAVLLLAMAATFGASSAFAEVTIEDVKFGVGERFKIGFWSNVRVNIKSTEATSGKLFIECADGDGLRSEYTSAPFELSGNESRDVNLLVRFGRSKDRLILSVKTENGQATSNNLRLPSEEQGMTLASQQIVLNLASDINLSAATQFRPDEPERMLVSTLADDHELPSDWLAYDGIDVIVLPTGHMDAIERISDGQLDAIDQWVRMGGALIISCAANVEPLFGDSGRLARFAPGDYVETVTQTELRGLEDFTEGSKLSINRSEGIPLALFENIEGRVECFEGFGTEKRPNVIRYAYGFGQILFLTHDLDRPPLADWDGRPRLISRLMSTSLDRIVVREDVGGLGQVSHLGFEDLSGQLRTALDQFSGGSMLPFSIIGLLAGIYILLIGPVDFFFLRALRRRMEWTWITFPLAVAGFCGLAYYMAQSWKGTSIRINQVDIVDFDFASDEPLMRGVSWAHLYSPTSRDYDLSINCRPAGLSRSASNRLLYWQGLPGKYFGAMDTGVGSLSGRPCKINYENNGGQQSTLDDFPVKIWSSRSITSRWWDTVDLDCESTLTAQSDDLLRGSFTNPLPSKIKDCWLFYERWAYRINNAGANSLIDLGSTGHPRNIEWLLTGRKVVDQKHISTPWEKNSNDVKEITEMMMLHEAALGRSYTNLLNRYQRYVDLSSHLQLGRAVLIGTLDDPVTQLLDNNTSMDENYDQRLTYCRLMIPVKKKNQ